MLKTTWSAVRLWIKRRLAASPSAFELQTLQPGVLDPARLFQAGLVDMLKDRRDERRSKVLRAALYAFMFTAPMLFYAGFYAWTAGYRLGPRTEVVGVVRLEGEMLDGSLGSAARVIPALREAFESEHVRAVVLAIDSPGGSPLEAERIYTAMAALKLKHPKPIVAVVNNLGASASYMVALHADRIYAGKYSLVGSIGAVLSGWDAHQALNRLGVSQRVYASGELKAMMNPYLAMTPEAERKARELVAEMGNAFKAELQQQRGTRLAQGVDLTSGGVWGGTEAQRLGLVDEVSTLEQVLLQSWPTLKPHEFGPRATSLPFGSAASVWLRDALSSALGSLLTSTANSGAASTPPLVLR